MRKFIVIFLFTASVFGATKPTSPVWQSGNPLASGVVRYWFVGSSVTTITDYSPSGQNLTSTGTATLAAAPGGVGNEYVFSGSNYASGVDTGLPSGTSSFTVGLWAKTSTVLASPGAAGLLVFGTRATAQLMAYDHINFSSFGAQFIANAQGLSPQGTVQTANTAINDGAWHRLMMVVSSGSVTFYRDGSIDGSQSTPLNIALSGTVSIGNGGEGGFVGNLGDVVVWNRALSSAEAASDFSDPWQQVRAGAPVSVGFISKNGPSGLATVSLTASSASGGTGPYSYQWQRSTYGAGTWTNVAGATALTLNDTGLAAGTNYDYRIIATDSVAATSTSSSLSIITLFPVDNANVGLTPKSWYVSGGSPAAFAATNRGGAEMRFGFTGTSASLVLDMTNVTPSNFLGVGWTVDDTARQTSLPAATLALGSGLATGTHSVRIVDIGQSSASNCWIVNGVTPDTVLKVLGIQLDVAASLTTPPSLPVDKMAFFGDSITAGAAAGPGGTGDSLYAYPYAVASALNSEPAFNGFSSAGWTVTAGGSNVPPFASAFGNYWAGQPRILTDVFKRAIVNLGTNDTSGYGSTVASGLTALRTALGANTKIYLFVPFGGRGRAEMNNGFGLYNGTVSSFGLSGTGAYAKGTTDPNTFLVDLGATAQSGLGGGASFESVDGTHPNTITQAKEAALIVQAVQQIEGGGAKSFSYAFSQ